MAPGSARPGPARRHAAPDGRARGLPRDPARLRGPDRDAQRAGRPDRHRGRPGGGGRRLRHEAVRDARARCQGAGRASPPDARGSDRARSARRRPDRDRHGREDRGTWRAGRAADPDGVRPARRAGGETRPGAQPRPAARPRLGLRLPRRFAPRRRGHRPGPRQDRARPGEPRADPHRARKRLQGRPLTRLRPMRGIRSRLALALVGLVVVTVAAIGMGTYAFVEARLRDGLLTEAERQAQFNLSVLIPVRLPAGVTRESYVASGLRESFRLRGGVETIVDYRDGGSPDLSTASLLIAIDGFPPSLLDVVAAGH